ncbi:MarR family winged helix-turn-helix transcriptional regulator [Paenibacillus rigui]|uniref:MarR family transcriptional regulator n=1 Tax=Paenibacillus rigui TaxID=554312 RepID=A0A229UQD9_9BACL|nr:MarR family winged helix-turn-helix transcriptional regulator [Paenibacillus rigui]OXM85777.1 MarR family transcriptional regulator [Paenibacillus rigui]
MDNQAFFHKFVAFTTAVHQVTHEMTKDIKSDDITPLQYKMVEYVAVSQPVTLSQISDCLHMSMPNTSRELKKLCDKQLCEKFTDTADRRRQLIRLTQEGQRMMDQAFNHIAQQFLARLQDATDEEWQALEQAMDLLHTKIFYSPSDSVSP